MISMIDFDKPMTDLFSPTFLDFKFSNLNYHVTLRRWTLIFRFLWVILWGLSEKKVEKIFWIFYKISDLSRFPAIWKGNESNEFSLSAIQHISDKVYAKKS